MASCYRSAQSARREVVNLKAPVAPRVPWRGPATRTVLPVSMINREGPIRQDECALVASRARSSGCQSRRRDHLERVSRGAGYSKVGLDGLQQHEPPLRLERAGKASRIGLERSELKIVADSHSPTLHISLRPRRHPRDFPRGVCFVGSRCPRCRRNHCAGRGRGAMRRRHLGLECVEPGE